MFGEIKYRLVLLLNTLGVAFGSFYYQGVNITIEHESLARKLIQCHMFVSYI